MNVNPGQLVVGRLEIGYSSCRALVEGTQILCKTQVKAIAEVEVEGLVGDVLSCGRLCLC